MKEDIGEAVFSNARVKERMELVARVVVVVMIKSEKGGGVIDAQPRTGNSGQGKKKEHPRNKRKEIIHNIQFETDEGKKR